VSAREQVGDHFASKLNGWSRFDRLSAAAAFIGASASFAAVATLADFETLFGFAIPGIVLAALVAFGSWAVKRAVAGRDVAGEQRLSAGTLWASAYWIVVKFGLFFGSLYLFIGAGISAVFGWPFNSLIESAALLILAMVLGDLIHSTILNVAGTRRPPSGAVSGTDI
jgi:hypothetical protein